MGAKFWKGVILYYKGGRRKVELRDRVVAIFERVKANKGIVSASGLVAELGVGGSELKGAGLYSIIKSLLISQGMRIPKHAHESVMADFDEVFGDRDESDKILIKKIMNLEISLEDFKKESGEVADKESVADNTMSGLF